MRRSATPIAPEETITTLCPSLRSLTTVSTIAVRIDRRGSCVSSWTMELVPSCYQQQVRLYFSLTLWPFTKLYNNCKLLFHHMMGSGAFSRNIKFPTSTPLASSTSIKAVMSLILQIFFQKSLSCVLWIRKLEIMRAIMRPSNKI